MRLPVLGLGLLFIGWLATPCAAECAHEIEPNETAASSTELGNASDGGCCVGSLASVDDIDVYGFAVELPMTVSLEIEGQGATRLRLYDGTGVSMASDRGSEAGGRTRIDVSLEAGRYAAVVDGIHGEVREYVIRLSSTAGAFESSCPSEKEDNGRFGFADVLELEENASCRSGSIDPRQDVDFYSFRLDSAAQISLWTISNGDTMLWLYDAYGAILDSNDDVAGAKTSAVSHVLAAGRYYAVVTSFGNRAVIPMYEIHLEIAPVEEPGDGMWTAEATGEADAPPRGWTLSGEGILFSTWGAVDAACAQGTFLRAGRCVPGGFEVTIPVDGYVALALVGEAEKPLSASATDRSGGLVAQVPSSTSSIYSAWGSISAGTMRVEVTPGVVTEAASFELYVLFSITPADEVDLILRYGPQDRTL